jgi:hypothetical protein
VDLLGVVLTCCAECAGPGISEFLHHASDEGFTRRNEVTDALDQHERRRELIGWLIDQDPRT